MSYRLCWLFASGFSSTLIPLANTQHNLYNTYLLLCVQYTTPDDRQKTCQKHVEFYSKNKFEKLVDLVGFIIEYITMHGPLNVKLVNYQAARCHIPDDSNNTFHCCCSRTQITYAVPFTGITGTFLSTWNAHWFFTFPACAAQAEALILTDIFTWFSNYYFLSNVLNVHGNVSWRKSAMSDVVMLSLMLIYVTMRCKGLERRWFYYSYILWSSVLIQQDIHCNAHLMSLFNRKWTQIH